MQVPAFAQTVDAKTETAGSLAPSTSNSAPEDAENESAELPVRLLDREPFDRITLDAENENAVIETVLLDLPERRVPQPLPESGTLEIRRFSHPSIPYAVQWSAVEKIELFEQLLLAEADRLTAAGAFAEGFEYLAFLSANYPRLPGLENALQAHLWREASATYAAGKRDEAWPVLHALYLRNPQYPRLANAVQAVSDDLIRARLEDRNYASARTLVDRLEKTFPKLPLANIKRWRNQFRADAEAQLAKARAALAAEQYSEAREAVARARSILPTIAGGEELWRQLQGTAPEIRVGVTQSGAAGNPAQTPDWATARVTDLVDPPLVQMVDFGAEGGVYASKWAEVVTSDDGLQTTLRLSPAGLRRGLAPDNLALRVVDVGAPGHPHRQQDFAALVEGVRLVDGRDVQIAWRRPHIRPEALLRVPLRWITTADRSPGLWFDAAQEQEKERSAERSYRRTGPADAESGAPRYIVEQVFEDDEAAIDALIRGDVDVIDRVPPWHVARMQRAEGIVVAPYRLPTVHVLIPNFQNPLVELREFRRAICYGIDSESIVRDILLGGQPQPGFRTISGPFPAGVSLSDPAGYAYNAELRGRPYEPRLASLLAGVARATLAKREAEWKKREQAATAKDKKDQGEVAEKNSEAEGLAAHPNESTDAAEEGEQEPAPPQPLLLAHPADPIVRLACQSIKIQLDQIGIPIKLVEVPGGAPAADVKYDLLYAELCVWEPIVDARRSLGPEGVAGRSSALMAMALDHLARAENWNQARAQLKEIHRIAYYDLSLVPLWQTVNHFAHRQGIEGIGASPVSLYQSVSAWRKNFQ